MIYITCFKIGHGFFHIFIAVSDKHLVTSVMNVLKLDGSYMVVKIFHGLAN